MNEQLTFESSGGGIGGLTTAIAIARLTTERKDIHVDLYEAVKEFTEVGAGVGMFRRPWSIMKALGIDKSLRKLDNIPEEGDPPGECSLPEGTRSRTLTCEFRICYAITQIRSAKGFIFL